MHLFVSHDRYFVDKIAKKLFVFKGANGKVEESFQPYSEYLEIEKELKDLSSLENSLQKEENEKTKEIIKKKQVKLSFNEQRDHNNLPKEIEDLEEKIEALNNCLMDPKCYEEKGIVAVSKELEEIETIYEKKVERFLELEELIESFNS